MRDKINDLAIIWSKPFKPPARPKVTIAIGLISKSKNSRFSRGQIVLASDSQTTFGATKSLDAKKISIVQFANNSILVAQAGAVDLADRVIEIMREKAKSVPMETSETAARIAQESIREVRNHLTELNKGCNFSDDAWKRFFRDENAFALLLGYYLNGKPYLFTIDIDWCLPIPIKNSYKAIGCGADLGEFLLREHWQADPDFAYSEVIATSVIEKVVDNMDGCGRPTWVAITNPFSKDENTASERTDAFICRREWTDAVAKELKEQELKFLAAKSKQSIKILQSLCKKIGPLFYTDSGDPNGDGGSRMGIFTKSNNEKELARILKKNKRFASKKNIKPDA